MGRSPPTLQLDAARLCLYRVTPSCTAAHLQDPILLVVIGSYSASKCARCISFCYMQVARPARRAPRYQRTLGSRCTVASSSFQVRYKWSLIGHPGCGGSAFACCTAFHSLMSGDELVLVWYNACVTPACAVPPHFTLRSVSLPAHNHLRCALSTLSLVLPVHDPSPASSPCLTLTHTLHQSHTFPTSTYRPDHCEAARHALPPWQWCGHGPRSHSICNSSGVPGVHTTAVGAVAKRQAPGAQGHQHQTGEGGQGPQGQGDGRLGRLDW